MRLGKDFCIETSPSLRTPTPLSTDPHVCLTNHLGKTTAGQEMGLSSILKHNQSHLCFHLLIFYFTFEALRRCMLQLSSSFSFVCFPLRSPKCYAHYAFHPGSQKGMVRILLAFSFSARRRDSSPIARIQDTL